MSLSDFIAFLLLPEDNMHRFDNPLGAMVLPAHCCHRQCEKMLPTRELSWQTYVAAMASSALLAILSPMMASQVEGQQLHYRVISTRVPF